MNNLNHSRTLAARLFAAGLLLASAASALADVRYVDVNSTNATPPYLSWATAATNIQDAVDAAAAGDEIVVTNGTYATGGHVVGRVASRVAVDKPLNVRSVNGPQFTAIAGSGSRCVYLNDGASLSGFTLTNGLAGGGGLSDPSGGGGGAYGGTLNDCTFTGNGAEGVGGGACNSTLNNCTLTGNRTGLFGGGAALCTLNNCTLTGNSAYYGGAAYGSTLNNCTLTGNSAGPGYGGGAYGGTLNNCIVYFNTATNDANFSLSQFVAVLNYCCTTPLPTNGVGNITNEPAFVNLAAGNYRLRPESPCIDAGTNLSATITNDLDGRPRPLDGNGDGLAAFDMGAYEYRMPFLVWQDSLNPTPPYSSWSTAATNIQDAVDAALAGDEIVVTNGIYATGGRAVYGTTTNRVAIIKSLSVRSVNGPAVTSIVGSGPTGPAAVRCVYLASGALLAGFTLTNGATQTTGDSFKNQSGGGVWCESQSALVTNCVLTRNGYIRRGGGAYSGTLNNCTLVGNSAIDGGGAQYSTLNNCTLTGNSAFQGGGAESCTLNNCTLTHNSANAGGAALDCVLNNCIAPFEGNVHYLSLSSVNHCWMEDPLFVDTNRWANLSLQSNSPCINAGRNAFAPAGPDLDGNPRIVGGTVDIGAYEFQSPTSIISYAWLQQYAQPTDGSADTADPDGDRLKNWQEWRCRTDPTNALSALCMLTPVTAGDNVTISWQSASGVSYLLERSMSLSASPAFTPLAIGIPGQSGLTSYTDTNAIGTGPLFYRVGVGD
jgi:hypothetical protein